MSREELLCKSANGIKVVFDPVNSHTATHFNDSPGLRTLAQELIKSLKLDGELIAKDIDMKRTVGDSDVVTIDKTDKLVYAMRKNREDQGYVPFTKSRSSQPSSLVSIHLIKKSEDTYELSSIWIGEYDSPMFPQMNNATKESIPYWSGHAFVWGSQEIIPGTERADCPW